MGECRAAECGPRPFHGDGPHQAVNPLRWQLAVAKALLRLLRAEVVRSRAEHHGAEVRCRRLVQRAEDAEQEIDGLEQEAATLRRQGLKGAGTLGSLRLRVAELEHEVVEKDQCLLELGSRQGTGVTTPQTSCSKTASPCGSWSSRSQDSDSGSEAESCLLMSETQALHEFPSDRRVTLLEHHLAALGGELSEAKRGRYYAERILGDSKRHCKQAEADWKKERAARRELEFRVWQLEEAQSTIDACGSHAHIQSVPVQFSSRGLPKQAEGLLQEEALKAAETRSARLLSTAITSAAALTSTRARLASAQSELAFLRVRLAQGRCSSEALAKRPLARRGCREIIEKDSERSRLAVQPIVHEKCESR